MQTPLQQLTDKLYQEGIAAGQSQAEQIIKEAQAKAESLVAEAKSQADALLQKAKNEAETQRKQTLSELELAGQKAINTVKQRIEELITLRAVEGSVPEAFASSEFLQRLILTLAEGWKESADMQITVAASRQAEIKSFLEKQAQHLLSKGVEVRPADNLRDGFRIGPHNNAYRIEFSSESFVAFFRSFLRNSTQSIVFGESSSESAQ